MVNELQIIHSIQHSFRLIWTEYSVSAPFITQLIQLNLDKMNNHIIIISDRYLDAASKRLRYEEFLDILTDKSNGMK